MGFEFERWIDVAFSQLERPGSPAWPPLETGAALGWLCSLERENSMPQPSSERNIEVSKLIERANEAVGQDELRLNHDLLLSAAAIVQRLDTMNLMIQLVVNELRGRR